MSGLLCQQLRQKALWNPDEDGKPKALVQDWVTSLSHQHGRYSGWNKRQDLFRGGTKNLESLPQEGLLEYIPYVSGTFICHLSSMLEFKATHMGFPDITRSHTGCFFKKFVLIQDDKKCVVPAEVPGGQVVSAGESGIVVYSILHRSLHCCPGTIG